MQSMHANSHWLVLLTLKGDWALGRDPNCVNHSGITSPFPPSGNEGYICTETLSLTYFFFMMHQMFSIGEISGLQTGQFSTQTLLLQSHAVVMRFWDLHCPAEIHVIGRGAYVSLKPLYIFQHS